MAKRIFIASTGRDVGKTSVSLGLAKALIEEGFSVGYIKPIGQRNIEIDGTKVSEDVFLIKNTFNLVDEFRYMSPFIAGKGVSSGFLQGKKKSPKNRILKAFNKIEDDKDVVIIEGTGHAGVGSVFDLSNAEVACLLNAPVLIVSEGGIGSTIDRITLNYSLFRTHGCTVSGIIINKVLEKKLEKIKKLLDKGIQEKFRLPVFGYMPYKSSLLEPSLSVVKESLDATVVNEGDNAGEKSLWDKQIEKVVLATVEPHLLMNEINETKDKILIITSSDRSDLILASLTMYHSGSHNILGLLLTGDMPPSSILKAINNTELPVILTKGNVYSLASAVHNLRVKITQHDKMKISILTELFEDSIDKDSLFEAIFREREIEIGWRRKFSAHWEKIKEFFIRIKDFFISLSRENISEEDSNSENQNG